MIIDVHTHAWEVPAHIDQSFLDELQAAQPGRKVNVHVEFDDYMHAMEPCDRAICFGMRARLTGLHVPNEFTAAFVARAPQKLIGFMSLDPMEPAWMDEFERARIDLKLKGVKLGPMYAGFDPSDRKLDDLYAGCVKHNLPVLYHVGTSFVRFGPLEYTRPILIDTVARRFPDLKIIMAHLGHPWEGETIAVIRKHPNVYADISALHYRPWQFYNSMMLAQEYGSMHKILFGSDYPFTTPAASIAGLRNLNRFCEGTHLPRVDLDAVEQLIHRDAIQLLWGGQP